MRLNESTRTTGEKEASTPTLSGQDLGFKMLVEKLPHAVILTGPDFNILYANAQAADMLGLFDPPSAIGRDFLDFLEAEGRQRLTAFAAKTGSGAIWQRYQQNERGSGHPGPVLNLTKILKKDGRAKGFLIAADPATEDEQQAYLLENNELKAALLGTASMISSTIKLKDPVLAEHQKRVTKLAGAIAKEMGLPETVGESLDVAGNVHDVGKLIVPEHILLKPDKLTDQEFRVVQNHVHTVQSVIKRIDFPWPVVQAICQHHERLDGSGYPNGLRGDGIILEARILAVADVMEAMTSRRVYRAAMSLDDALEEICVASAALFDPQVAEACRVLFKEKIFNFSSI